MSYRTTAVHHMDVTEQDPETHGDPEGTGHPADVYISFSEKEPKEDDHLLNDSTLHPPSSDNWAEIRST